MNTTPMAAQWPIAQAIINPDGTACVSIGGREQTLGAANVEEVRPLVIEMLADKATQLGRPLRAITEDPGGRWPVIINPDGTVIADDTRQELPTPATGQGEPEESGKEQSEISPDSETISQRSASETVERASEAAATDPPVVPFQTRSARRQSFLTQEQIEEPATKGWRGVLTRLGVRMTPSTEEREERVDVAAVSQHWPGPRTIAIVNGKGGAGKALAVGEPVLTPAGYRPIGELEIGDAVYGTDGLPHRVLGVFPQGERELFRINFSDGSHVIADGDHLWEVESVNDRHRGPLCEHEGCDRRAIARGYCHPHYRQFRRHPSSPLANLRTGAYPTSVERSKSGNRVMTTSQLIDSGLKTYRPGRGWRHKFFVPVAAAVEFAPTETPLDPYFVGLLLGDGSISNPALAFTTADAELAKVVQYAVPAGVRVRHKDRYDYRMVRTAPSGPNPLRAALEALGIYGLTSENKFIPDVYKMGDILTRLAVLQGLLDTDGSVERGIAASFTSSSRRLAQDVKFVAESLGCVVSGFSSFETTYHYKEHSHSGKTAWTIRIKAPKGLELFRLGRKRELCRAGQRPPYRAIESINPAGRGQAVCISVQADDHLFLTRSCIPTHNTPSTVCLAAVFARYGGAGVLSWDNNQTRGTLGWRTEQGPHEATLLELLPQVDRLLGTGSQSADLAHYVHHQTRDRFDVLRSKPMELASAQRISAGDVDAIHQVASKYYRLIFIDSGNDESDPMWQRMIDHTDQLVVATTTRDDHAEAGALLLEALTERDPKSAELAKNAVVIVTQADSKATPADIKRVAEGYQTMVPAVITVPFDPAMVDGLLRYGSLRPTTQRSWLKAAAAVAQRL